MAYNNLKAELDAQQLKHLDRLEKEIERRERVEVSRKKLIYGAAGLGVALLVFIILTIFGLAQMTAHEAEAEALSLQVEQHLMQDEVQRQQIAELEAQVLAYQAAEEARLQAEALAQAEAEAQAEADASEPTP